jgi:hypothetical protein
VVGVEKKENLFVSTNQPGCCLVVFSEWTILRTISEKANNQPAKFTGVEI